MTGSRTAFGFPVGLAQGLAATSLLAAGAVATLRWRRRTALQQRPPGLRLPTPLSEAQAEEARLAVAAAPDPVLDDLVAMLGTIPANTHPALATTRGGWREAIEGPQTVEPDEPAPSADTSEAARGGPGCSRLGRLGSAGCSTEPADRLGSGHPPLLLGTFNPKDDGSGFHWFYDRARSRLVTEFVLDKTPQTLTYCEVKLIAKGDTFEPRLFLKKDAITSKRWKQAQEQVENTDAHLMVKAAVDLNKAHENFWRLVTFLTSFENITVPGERLPLVVADEQVAGLVDLLQEAEKRNVLEAVKVATGGDLTESDFRLLRDRKAALNEFERLLEAGYIQARVSETNARGEEDVWQAFFEEHPWIFGYGLKLIAAEGLKERLEQTTTGATVFGPTGDRVDALMATKGLIQSLMFTEIKTASTDLLAGTEYRSGVYHPSRELAGAVSQVQTTAHRAVRMLEDLHRPTDRQGWSREVVGTIRPRQVVVVGGPWASSAGRTA